ncbi:MAG: chromate transporter [Clostridia bacterium]|nr:chromate transporter [Clostridia bacterium]
MEQGQGKSSIFTLFLTFFKIGAFTFGGGYAMIPLIQKEVADNRHWITGEDILDIVAIAESTPGPLAINTATFVGYKVGGFSGAFAATLGVVLPSFMIISLIALVLRQFEQIQAVQFAFNGIRAGVLALMCKALYSMYRQTHKSAFSYAVMAGALLLVAFTQINVLLVIVGCAVAGLLFSAIAGHTEGGRSA